MIKQDDGTPTDEEHLDETQRLLEEMDATMQRVRRIIDGPSTGQPPVPNDDDKKGQAPAF